jgi:hypothetical protein
VIGVGGDLQDEDQPAFDDPEFGFERLANDPIAWLAQSRLPPDERSPWYDRGRYPMNGTVREFYLDSANKLTTRDLRGVLRALLPDGTGIVGSDFHYLKYNSNTIAAGLRSGEATEYERRLVKAMLGRKTKGNKGKLRKSRSAAPIPDLTWIIDLVFSHPTQAFEVAHAYLGVHFWILPDQVIDGVFDFMATVRCHFRLDSSEGTDVALLCSLSPRSLEYLTAALWNRMGYKTSVTKAPRDGGKDVIARRGEPGQSETVLIECRQWRKHISVTAPQRMIGVMSDERANKGVIVAPGGFAEGTGSATEYAARIKTVELVNGPKLAALMTKHNGPRWPVDIDCYIQDGRRIADG